MTVRYLPTQEICAECAFLRRRPYFPLSALHVFSISFSNYKFLEIAIDML